MTSKTLENKSNGKIRRQKNNLSSDESISRSLSWVLRHSALKLGLNISSDGYVPVDDILICHNRFKNITKDDIFRVVRNDAKNRYNLVKRPCTNASKNDKDDIWLIRCNQGHSISIINDEKLLTKISYNELRNYSEIVHGTFQKAWFQNICDEGLSRMKRNNIHFTTFIKESPQTKPISGMRSNCEVLIYLDIPTCIEDGIIFYKSSNDVILTSGKNSVLPIHYFSKVVDISNQLSFYDGKAFTMHHFEKRKIYE